MRFAPWMLAALLMALPASADEPGAPSSEPNPGDMRERIRERMRERAAHDRDQLGPAPSGPLGAPNAADDVRDQRRQAFRQRVLQMREMRAQRERIRALRAEIEEALKQDAPDRELLQRKLDELRALKDERRREHRASVFLRWGAAVERPDVKDELELNARRLARLDRLEFLAATERKPAAHKRLEERITKLRAVEEQRHQSAMSRLIPERAESTVASSTPAKVVAPPPVAATPAASASPHGGTP